MKTFGTQCNTILCKVINDYQELGLKEKLKALKIFRQSFKGSNIFNRSSSLWKFYLQVASNGHGKKEQMYIQSLLFIFQFIDLKIYILRYYKMTCYLHFMQIWSPKTYQQLISWMFCVNRLIVSVYCKLTFWQNYEDHGQSWHQNQFQKTYFRNGLRNIPLNSEEH